MSSLYVTSPGFYKALRWFSRALWLGLIAVVIALGVTVSNLREELATANTDKAALRDQLAGASSALDYYDAQSMPMETAGEPAGAGKTDGKHQPAAPLERARREKKPLITAEELAKLRNDLADLELAVQDAQRERDVARGEAEQLREMLELSRPASGASPTPLAGNTQPAASLDDIWTRLLATPDDQLLRGAVRDILARRTDAECVMWLDAERAKGSSRDLVLWAIESRSPEGIEGVVRAMLVDASKKAGPNAIDAGPFIKALRGHKGAHANAVRAEIAGSGAYLPESRAYAACELHVAADSRAPSLMTQALKQLDAGAKGRALLLATATLRPGETNLDMAEAVLLDTTATQDEVQAALVLFARGGADALKRMDSLVTNAAALGIAPARQAALDATHKDLQSRHGNAAGVSGR